MSTTADQSSTIQGFIERAEDLLGLIPQFHWLRRLRASFATLSTPASPAERNVGPKKFARAVRAAFRCSDELLNDRHRLAELARTIDEAAALGRLDEADLLSWRCHCHLLLAIAAFDSGDIPQAHQHFVTARELTSGANPAPLFATTNLLHYYHDLHSRGYAVYERVVELYDRCPLATRILQQRCIGDRKAVSAPTAGVIRVPVVCTNPVEANGDQWIGGVATIIVLTKRASDWSIGFSPAFSHRLAQHDDLLAVLASAAKQVLTVMEHLFPKRPCAILWELTDLPDPSCGLSLSLGLTLAILSSITKTPLPPGCIATGCVDPAGGVNNVEGLGVKVSAGSWSGGRQFIYPAIQTCDLKKTDATRLLCFSARLRTVGVATVREACNAINPRLVEIADSAPLSTRLRVLIPVILLIILLWTIPALLGSGASPEKAKLAHRFVVLDGDIAFDSLAGGSINELQYWGAHTRVLDNDVLRWIRSIRKDYFVDADAFIRYPETARLVKSKRVLTFVYGDRRLFRRLPLQNSTFAGELATSRISRSGSASSQYYVDNGPEPGIDKVVHRFATFKSIRNWTFLDHDPLSRDLIRANPTKGDLIDLRMSVANNGIVPTHRLREVGQSRGLKVFVLDLENTGSVPVRELILRTSDFSPRSKTSSLKLRQDSELDEVLASKFNPQWRVAPVAEIGPGEHLWIPLRVGVGGVGEDIAASTPDDRFLPGGRTIPDYDNLPGELRGVQPHLFIMSQPIDYGSEPYRRTYFFGPAIEVREYSVAGPLTNVVTVHDPLVARKPNVSVQDETLRVRTRGLNEVSEQ